MDTKKKHYYGCIPSKMDGSEHVADVDMKVQIPDEFDLRNVMPPVRDQGATQTCVCQTLTGVLDFLHNSNVGTDGKCNNFSINTLYDSRSNKPQDGMSIKEALSYLKHKGLNGQKINSYALVPSAEILKRALIMFGPVAAGFPVYTSNDPYFWRKGSGYVGGHCVTIVGYTKKGFIIRNSWGRSWGNNGHIVIPFDEYNKCVFEAWTTTL